MAALDLVLGLGNVLSYARLMALGLASVMLAEVANLVATTLRPAVAGIAIGVLLHAGQLHARAHQPHRRGAPSPLRRVLREVL